MGGALSPGAGELAPHLSPVLVPLLGFGVSIPGAGVPPPAPPGGCIPPHPRAPPHPHTGTVKGGAVLGGVGRGSMMEDRKELKFFHSE